MDKEAIEDILRDAERAFGIMGGCVIDLLLENILKLIMINDSTVNELFDSYQPFGTLAAKIDCTYAFGLIDKKTKNDLNYIRKIRNEFAHTFEKKSFHDSPISEWCAALTAANDSEVNNKDPHEIFRYTVSSTIKRLGSKIQDQQKKSNNKKSQGYYRVKDDYVG